MKTAFIGLGVMGYPMAAYLGKRGHEVTVYNRTAARAEEWCGAHAGSMAATPAEAAAGVERDPQGARPGSHCIPVERLLAEVAANRLPIVRPECLRLGAVFHRSHYCLMDLVLSGRRARPDGSLRLCLGRVSD